MKQAFVALFSLCLAAYSCAESVDVPAAPASKESYLQANTDDSRAISALCEGFSYALEQSVFYDPTRYKQGVSVRSTYSGKFPLSVYFEFTGECDDGVVRDGTITAKMDTVPWQVDSKIELTYSNYSANGAKLTGVQNLTVTQISYTDMPLAVAFVACTSSVKDASLMEVVDKDPWLAKWSGEQVWEWNPTPEQLLITGSGRGTTRLGFSYNCLIVSDVEKYRDCKYLGMGVEQMAAGKDTATLDFGNDECDRFVSLTFHEETSEVKLPY